MRIYLLITTLTCFLFIQTCFAQKKEIFSRPYHSTIKKGTLKEYLEEINSKSGLVIEYASNNLQLGNTIELDGNETSLGILLQKILNGQHIKLVEKNSKIILAPSSTPVNPDDLVPSYTIFGFVKESAGKETMMDATIIDVTNSRAITTNAQGYYSLSLPEGDHQLQISYSGFEAKKIAVSLHSDTRFDVELLLKPEMEAVTVTAEGNIKKNASDKVAHDVDESYNYIFGESDPLRSVSFLPGVVNASENFSSMLVRGGGPDENLFLLDGTQVYNPSHFLGAFSIVSETMLKNLRLYKSDFPAKFSGSLSSVMDVYTKDGNLERWQGEANAGVLSGAFTVQGPIVKNKTAFVASFRHSWASPIWGQFENNLKPDFYDIDGKLTQLIGKNDKLIIGFYMGQDKINQSGSNVNNLHQWGNMLGSFKWSHLIGARSVINAFADFSQYNNLGGFRYSLLNDHEDTVQTKSIGTLSSIEHYNAKLQGDFYLSKNTRLNAGAQYNHTITKPFETKTTTQLEDNQQGFNSIQPLAFDVFSGYAELEYQPTHFFIVRPGLHVSDYQFYNYQNFSFQPRLYAALQFNNHHQLFAAYNKMTQFLHLVANPYLGLNADPWVPSTANLKPEESDSYTLGYEFRNGRRFIISLEGYWKSLQNVTNYVNGKSYFINDTSWQQNLESGKGYSYGMESMLKWSPGKFSMLISYTLSWSWRIFQDINNGLQVPYKYDRRHVANLALAYHLSKHFDISGSFCYSSGEAVLTPGNINPNNNQQNNGEDDIPKTYQFIYQYNDSSQYRSAGYFREDFAIRYHSLKEKKNQVIITAGMYNIAGAPDQYTYDLLGSLNSKNLVAQTTRTSYNFFPYISITMRF